MYTNMKPEIFDDPQDINKLKEYEKFFEDFKQE